MTEWRIAALVFELVQPFVLVAPTSPVRGGVSRGSDKP